MREMKAADLSNPPQQGLVSHEVIKGAAIESREDDWMSSGGSAIGQ